MKAKHHFILSMLMVIAVLSCEPFDKDSEIPEVKFKSFTKCLVDTLDVTIEAGNLVFSFVDGDANFGLDADDGNENDTINLYINAFQKINGVYDSIDSEIYGRRYGIQNDDKLTRTGQYKTIKGEISVIIYYFLIPPYDTIRYDFYILDRAGNKSNVESTTDIAFSDQ